MKILIAGSNGMIGSAVTRHLKVVLLQRDYQQMQQEELHLQEEIRKLNAERQESSLRLAKDGYLMQNSIPECAHFMRRNEECSAS